MEEIVTDLLPSSTTTKPQYQCQPEYFEQIRDNLGKINKLMSKLDGWIAHITY